MELRHLRLVETVAAEGSLTKAVSRLNVSPSALSHQLKEIESEVGTQLFYRINKKLVITDAGKVLLDSAQKVLRELEKVEQDLMILKDGQLGELKITTECYTCYHWLPGLMKTFSKDFPCVDVTIKTEYTSDPISALLDGKVDAVITSNYDDNPAIEFRELFRDEMVAVVPIGHPWEQKKFVEAKDFADQTVVIYKGPLESVTLFRKLLIPEQVMPKKIMEMQLTEAQIEMVKAGYCVKVLANWAIQPYLKTQPLTTVPITRKGLQRTWYIASLKKDEHPAYYESFIKSLVRQLRSGDV